MIIRLAKAKNAGRSDTLTCIRDDGSRTGWTLTPHFVEHDLAHFAVESTLGLHEAFYGLIAGGRDIAEFGTRNGQPDNVPAMALHVEWLVGSLQLLVRDETLDFASLAAVNPPPQFDSPLFDGLEEKIEIMRALLCDLKGRWHDLAAGETLELNF